MNSEENNQEKEINAARLTRVELFLILLKAGLAFGGGLGILAVLDDELVSKHRAVSKEDFLTIYGIGRITPSGTMTALAVAYGYRCGGISGTVIALAALALSREPGSRSLATIVMTQLLKWNAVLALALASGISLLLKWWL